MSWGFYGRQQELQGLRDMLNRQRWFFARITGRRRIGKTTLVQQALQATPTRPVFYVQIPDSAPAGVLSAAHDAMETFGLPPDRFPRPDSLLAFARTVGQLASPSRSVPLARQLPPKLAGRAAQSRVGHQLQARSRARRSGRRSSGAGGGTRTRATCGPTLRGAEPPRHRRLIAHPQDRRLLGSKGHRDRSRGHQ